MGHPLPTPTVLFSMALLPPPLFQFKKALSHGSPKDHRRDRWPDRLGQGSRDRPELPELSCIPLPPEGQPGGEGVRPPSPPRAIPHFDPGSSSGKQGPSYPPFNTVSPLHTNLLVANFQRCEPLFTRPVTQVSSRVYGISCHLYCHHAYPLQGPMLLYTVQCGKDSSTTSFLSSPRCPEAIVKAAVYN